MAEIEEERAAGSGSQEGRAWCSDTKRLIAAIHGESLTGFLFLTNNEEPATCDFRFTPSRPRSAISYSPVPSCRREIVRSGTAAPPRESISPPSLRPSSRRRSGERSESSSRARARPLQAAWAGRKARPPAPPSHAALAIPHILPRSGKTTDLLPRVAACPVPRTPFEIPLPAFECCPCRRTQLRTVRRASGPARPRRSLSPPRESSGAPRWKTPRQIPAGQLPELPQRDPPCSSCLPRPPCPLWLTGSAHRLGPS